MGEPRRDADDPERKNSMSRVSEFRKRLKGILSRSGKPSDENHAARAESSFRVKSKLTALVSRIDPLMRYRVGIDIGHFSVKFVIIERVGENEFLRDWWIIDRKGEGYSDSVAEMIQVLEEKLLPMVGRWSCHEVPLYIALLGKRVLVKKLTMPVIPDKEIKRALLLKFENEIAALPEDIGFGYHVSSMIDDNGEEGLEVTTAVARAELLEAVITPFEAAGFSHVTILASSMLFSNQMKSAEPNLIVDIGFEKTGVYVTSGEDRYLYREIAMGGNSFTDSITGRFSYSKGVLELKREAAEILKKKYGLLKERVEKDDNADEAYAHIPAILRPTVDKLTNEIRRTSEYLSSGSSWRPEKILLVGGGSSLAGLSEYLEAELESGVRYITFEDLGMSGMGETANDIPVHELAHALSSAVWMGKSESLTHPAYRVRTMMRFEGKLFKYAALVLAACIISYSSFTHNMFSRFHADTVLINSSTLLAGSFGSDMIGLSKERSYLETMKTVLDYPLPEGPEAVTVLRELSHIIPDYVLVTRLDLIPRGDSAEVDEEFEVVNPDMRIRNYGVDEEESTDAYSVIIDGVIKSEPLFLEAYLSKFNLILRNSGVFQHSDIISWERGEGKDSNRIKFSINCKLNEKIEEM